jgi:uncharacterized protein
VRFWDASAVVSLCMSDPSARAVRRMAEEDAAIAAWWGTVVECHSALFRLRRQGDIGAAEVERARQVVVRLAEGWSEVLPSQQVRDQALRALSLHQLRAADAFHLAAALVWVEGHPHGRHFVSLDTRQRDAARAEGFTVLPLALPR